MKSLHLNWIRNIDKSLVMPNVIFPSTLKVGGWYSSPEEGQEYIDGCYYDKCFGIIAVDGNLPEKDHAGVIAHEWRHHWQICHGWKFDGMGEQNLFHLIDSVGYDTAILKFFSKSKAEMDALKFQYKYSGVYESWEYLVHDYLT